MAGYKKLSMQDLQKTLGGGKSPYYEPWRTPGKMNSNLGWATSCAVGAGLALYTKDWTHLTGCIPS
ncbi:hypothetical protein [Companilactobacillus insicii]|uniref:hypothetical protein n=1 Tax=Companilactobacillus insicii TaxID=1732567 RepID=UPI000F7AAC93|nr:hypothetical protein [Companilactobacillus insicii]